MNVSLAYEHKCKLLRSSGSRNDWFSYEALRWDWLAYLEKKKVRPNRKDCKTGNSSHTHNPPLPEGTLDKKVMKAKDPSDLFSKANSCVK